MHSQKGRHGRPDALLDWVSHSRTRWRQGADTANKPREPLKEKTQNKAPQINDWTVATQRVERGLTQVVDGCSYYAAKTAGPQRIQTEKESKKTTPNSVAESVSGRLTRRFRAHQPTHK